MKVAVVTKHFPHSQQRWAGHSAYQTLKVLATLCDLHVFFPEAAYPALLTPKASRRPALDREWNPEGVKTTYIPYPVLPVISRPLNGFTIASRLLPHVRRFAPDIVLSYFIYPDGYAAVRIAKALGVPAVVTAVGSDINRIPDALCRHLTSSTLREAEFVSTVSHDLCAKSVVLGSNPARTRAKLNGCDTSLFRPGDRAAARQSLGIDPDAEAVVYIGRLDTRKGLVELVEAVAQLSTRRPKLRCYIVGDGPDKQLLLDAITRLNAQGTITIIPSCPTAQVATWMTASNLVTLPSYNEGCPNVVVEALAAGRPVVATNVGGIPELMDDTCGRMVPAREVAPLVEALDQVLSQTWDANAISTKHSRSWADVAGELYKILEESIQRKSGNSPALDV